MKKTMDKTFWFVANSLNQIAYNTHTTYNEINIIVYYLIVPLTWSIMLDIIIGYPVFTILTLLVWSFIFYKTRKYFREWCDLGLRKSQEFLFWFKRIGWNYIIASVIICVIIPLIVYGLLCYGIYLKYY